MNDKHLALCSSAEWAEAVQRWIVPWVLDGLDLGDDVLEVGPGPGLTTDVLQPQVRNLTAIELDTTLAAKLADRFAGTNVDVVCTDSLDGPEFRELHVGDICLPVEPDTLAGRLMAAGYVDVEVATNDYGVRFRAHK